MKSSQELVNELEKTGKVVFTITRSDIYGTKDQQLKTATKLDKVLTKPEIYDNQDDFFNGNPRALVILVDHKNEPHYGYIKSGLERLVRFQSFKVLYLFTYVIGIKDKYEKHARYIHFTQHVFQDNRQNILMPSTVYYLKRDYENDPDMFEKWAFAYKNLKEAKENMIEKLLNASIPEEAKNIRRVFRYELFSRLLNGKLDLMLENGVTLPSKAEGEVYLKKQEELEAKKRKEQADKELLKLSGNSLVSKLSDSKFKEIFNKIARRYHAYDFKDAIVKMSPENITINLTSKMTAIYKDSEITMSYQDGIQIHGVKVKSDFNYLTARAKDIKILVDEIIDKVFCERFPDLVNRDYFYKNILEDFHKYYHGLSAW